MSEGKNAPSRLESGGNGGGVNNGRKAGGGDYLSCILGLVVSVQELDVLRDNLGRILALAETALIERERLTFDEQVPVFLLQFLDLLLEIRDEGRLFLESGH